MTHKTYRLLAGIIHVLGLLMITIGAFATLISSADAIWVVMGGLALVTAGLSMRLDLMEKGWR